MMLIESSLPASIAAGLSSISDHGQQEFSCVWIPGDLTWQEPAPVYERKTKDDNSCSRNFLSFQPSIKINMPETSTPNFVYKRRKIQTNSSSVVPLSQSSTPTFVYKRRKVQRKPTAVFPAQVSTDTTASDGCFSAYSSETTSVSGKEHMISLPDIDNGAIIAPDLIPFQSNRLDLALKSGSIDGASTRLGPMIEENHESKMRKALELCAINDNCSSLKSNIGRRSASMKLQVDDVGECSSSGAQNMEGSKKDISEKNPCTSFLKRHGVLERLLSTKTRRSEKLMGVRKNIGCLRLCKVCNQRETTLKMLICDLCEESSHVSCCYPCTKKVPIDEWFCDSCLRKKLKKLKETNSRKSTKDNSGPIASMLRGADAYTSNVRIGKDFQAEVPDWSGPIINDLNDYGERLEISPVECRSQDWNSSKLSRFSSIGNWLQCREVIDGDCSTICGKWRRAPLFEVQTDDWECFRSVLWDPTHADCAVPQELDTEQVLKHLKYMEMLRPRLTAKRCKLGVNKGANSQ